MKAVWVGCLVSCCLPLATYGNTLRVPSQYPTIQAALGAAAAGDTVLLAPGRYTGPGNRELMPPGVDFVLRSEAGPEATIIELDGPGIYLYQGETRQTVIEGLTMVDGSGAFYGAAIINYNASPTIRNCVLGWNQALTDVAGVGAGIFCGTGNPLIVGCTIASNHALEEGSGIYLESTSHAELVNTVCWGNCSDDVFIQEGASATFTCCVYGNIESRGEATFEKSIQGNPLFCLALPCDFIADHDPSRLRVDADSPCLPGNNDCGVLIGALGVGCPTESAPEEPEDAGPVGARGPGRARLLTRVSPNPARGSFTCILARHATLPFRLELIDAAGRVVCSRWEQAASVTAATERGGAGLRWDPTSSGCRIPSGVYHLRITAAEGDDVRSLVVIR